VKFAPFCGKARDFAVIGQIREFCEGREKIYSLVIVVDLFSMKFPKSFCTICGVQLQSVCLQVITFPTDIKASSAAKVTTPSKLLSNV